MALASLEWIGRIPIAHRGLHDSAAGCLENTRAAFSAAISRGFAFELDVQRSADGDAMVFHDDTLDRLMQQEGHVDAFSATELGTLAFKGGAARIEPLTEILSLTAGRVPIVIEIKSAFRGDMRLTERVAAIVSEYRGPFVLKSFDPGIVLHLKRIAPHLPRGIVSMCDYGDDPETAHLSAAEMRNLTEMLHFPETQPDFVSWHVGDLPCAGAFFPRSLLGRPLMTWTVRQPDQIARARAFADQMIFEGFIPET
jgi:glycerophosphoryl diester phosphodiesterase